MQHNKAEQDHLKNLHELNEKRARASAFDSVVSDPFGDMQVPSFPMQLVPKVISEFANTEASMSGFDAGGYAICTLMSLASLIDFRTTLKVNHSWREPPMMWFGVVSESGEGKSPVIKASMQFLDKIDTDMKRNSMREHAEWKKEMERFKAKAKNSKSDPIDPPAEPSMQMLVMNDSTVEAMARVLVENPQGVMYFSAELNRWISSIDAYSSGKGNKDRGAYLEAYDGGGKSISRVHGGFTFVPNWGFSVLGGIQPEVFAQIFKSSQGNSSDGLYQRFMLYCMQPSGSALLANASINDAVYGVQVIADRIHAWAKSGKIEMDKPVLSDQSLLEFQDYLNAMRELQRRTSDPRFSEHLGKFAGFALRLTLALHVVECAAEGEDGWNHIVQSETLKRALSIMSCLYRHSEAMYSKAVVSRGSSRDLVRDVANLILARGWEQFTFGDLERNCTPWRDFDKHKRNDAIDLLIEMGWLMDITPEATGGRGRKAQGRFAVNPLVHDQFKEQAEQERDNRALRKAALDRAVTQRRAEKARDQANQ